MAWTRPVYTHPQVNKAGRVLTNVFSPQATLEADLAQQMAELEQAFLVVNNWRSAHSYPLQSIKMTLRGRAKKQDKSSLIAQRIKRIPAIELKLRNNERMTLSSMHDIGGCRAVMRTVSLVEKMVTVYEEATARNPRRGGEFSRKYDYITNPKPSGYRGVHLVYKYHSDSKSLKIYNGLKIEIQIRSALQHAWATAVETVSMFTGQALKSNIGEESWKRFFALAASAFAQMEKRPAVPGTPIDPAELKNELNTFAEQIALLRGFTVATEQFDKKNGHVFLLELNPSARAVKTTAFQQNELELAQEKYLETEKAIKDHPGTQVVLVSVESFASLRKAYPNYFLDIRGFLANIEKVIAG